MHSLPVLYYEIGGGSVLLLLLLIFFLFRPKKKTQIPSIREVEELGKEVTTAPKRDLRSVLARTSDAFTSKLDALILSTKSFDESFLENLEELLYTSDLGPKTVEGLLVRVREKLARNELSDLQSVKKGLSEEIQSILEKAKPQNSPTPSPRVILVVGVNGVGKTTSIGKLAQYYSRLGKKVLVVAGDTFRAAAESQLAVWGQRAQVEVYTSETTKDPAAVAYQGIQKGAGDQKDVVIVDTAGRLHNKENLMEELKKVKRVAAKALPNAPHEIILVIDANSGQNARVQAEQFNVALGLTSLIVTKLDGTARGGVIVSIASELGLGVQFVGLGEGIDDFEVFSPQEFTRALLKL